MTKIERRKVLVSVGTFTIGNSVSTWPQGQCQLPCKCSLGMLCILKELQEYSL